VAGHRRRRDHERRELERARGLVAVPVPVVTETSSPPGGLLSVNTVARTSSSATLSIITKNAPTLTLVVPASRLPAITSEAGRVLADLREAVVGMDRR